MALECIVPRMSLRELKNEIRRLNPAELAEIEALVEELRAGSLQPESGGLKPGTPMGRSDAMDHVFENYRPLLRRLAE
jgi:hypothetical protein